jgi:hypothetical protein
MCAGCAQAVDNGWGIPPRKPLTWENLIPTLWRKVFGRTPRSNVPYRLRRTATPGQRTASSVEKGHPPAVSDRDRERGEDGPRERQPIVPWEYPADPSPAHPYDQDTGRFRTPSRRRAAERGQQEPVDPYLPPWALESGVRSADGEGRHAADDDVAGPRSAGGPRRPGAPVGTTWRSATVALAAAVVGGGLSTVMVSAVTGQPLG